MSHRFIDAKDEAYAAELRKAMDFAHENHFQQVRKQTLLPYIFHPVAVAARLRSWHITDLVTLKAALAHDTIEDCGAKYESLVKVMGKETADVVVELTFDPAAGDQGQPEHVRKAAYFSGFHGTSVEALVIKVADVLCNADDYKITSPTYVAKFHQKRFPVMEAMQSRHVPIIDKFGRRTYWAMVRDNLNRMNYLDLA